MTLSRQWCPRFPDDCPYRSQPGELDQCETKATDAVACTLDRVGAPRPVVNGVTIRQAADGSREFLLVRRRPGLATQADRWGLPGGGLHCGESVEQAVAREVLEETGWRVEVETVTSVRDGAVHLLSGGRPFVVCPDEPQWDDPNAYVGFFCQCRPRGEASSVADPNTAASRWFTEAEVSTLIERNEVTPLDTAVLQRCFGVR